MMFSVPNTINVKHNESTAPETDIRNLVNRWKKRTYKFNKLASVFWQDNDVFCIRTDLLTGSVFVNKCSDGFLRKIGAWI